MGKEFDKWFSADGTLIPQPGDAGYEGYVERRIAWYAALEWALKNGYYDGMGYYRGWEDIIKEELNNGNT